MFKDIAMVDMIFLLIYFAQFNSGLGVSPPISGNGNGVEPRLLCPNLYCTKEYAPVCGSDGVTYGNLCEFNRTRGCSNAKNLTVTHKGKCGQPPTTIPGKPSDCHLPSDTGMCRAYFKKWYYDSRSKTCKQFVYGGCGGNDNRFSSEAACKRSCEPARPSKCASVFCSNWRGSYTKCRIPNNRVLRSVHLQKQRSRKSCRFPSLKYGIRQNMIWVWQGCKGIFNYCYTTGEPKYFDEMRCSSTMLHQQKCKIPAGRKLLEVTLKSQLSPISCTRPSRKFGITYDNQLLVTRGCSGVFKYGYVPDGTSCASVRSKTNTHGLLGAYIPQCKSDGTYEERQCHGSTGHCWCVDPDSGTMYEGSRKSPDQGAVNCGLSLNVSNTIWSWYFDGKTKNAEVKFTADKKVIWNSGAPEGSWSVEKDTIRATINNMRYELKGNVFTKEAVVVVPYRKPASKMVQIVQKSCAQVLAEVDRRIADFPVPKCNADGTYQAKQCDEMARQCWCVETVSGKMIPATKKGHTEGLFLNCSIWRLLQTNICFGAKLNSFGTIKIQERGKYNSLLLVHNYGYVGCAAERQSHWGCGASEDISIAITDNKNKLLFPSYVNRMGWYKIPGYNSKSKMLKLENLRSPSAFEEGDEMRIWYGEDLRGYTEHDNHGEVCAKVYAGYSGFPTPCHDKLAVIRVAVGGYIPQCKADGRYEEKQCHASTGYCWCVDPDTGKTIDGTKKGSGEGEVECSPTWKFQQKVCFGARDTKFGKFTMKNAGMLKKIRLVHSTGYVACHGHGHSNWGCGTTDISIIITNEKNSILFPNNADPRGWYRVPQYTSRSKTLQLEKPTRPIPVKLGDVIKVWYGEDFTGHTESDNHGEACANVYVMIDEVKPPCPKILCDKSYSPVCGSDGKTYSNLCEFNKAKGCHGTTNLTIVKKGPCYERPCPEIMCIAIYSPVCGSNGLTYSNECELKKAQGCQGVEDLTLRHKGECNKTDIVVTIPPMVVRTTAVPDTNSYNETKPKPVVIENPTDEMMYITGTIKYPKQTDLLPTSSCATILFIDNSLMDMPYKLLESSTLEVAGANLNNGILYKIDTKRPRSATLLSISVTINVGWCAKASNESMQEGDFLTIGSERMVIPSNQNGNISIVQDVVVECYGKCYAERITVSGEITYLGRTSILPQHSCAIIKILDSSLFDVPSVTIETKIINVTSFHLINGIKYEISARKPEHDAHMYSLSVTVNVGWCAAQNMSGDEWLKAGDYIDAQLRDISHQFGETNFTRDVDLKCYECNECTEGFYKNSNGTCVQVEKLFKAEIKMLDIYSPALDNTSSPEYHRMAIMVESRLLLATKESLTDIVDVRVTGFRPGSIIAEYDIIIDNDTPVDAITSTQVSRVITDAIESGRLDELKPDRSFAIDVEEINIGTGRLAQGIGETCSNFTCEPNKLCTTGSPNQFITKVILTKESSNNVCNHPIKKYGIHRNRLWVKDGCFATFKYCYKVRNMTEKMVKIKPNILKPKYCKTVYCSSNLNSHYSICETGKNHTMMNVTVVRRTSRASCIGPKRKYGLNSNKLWVAGGCSGYFRYCYDIGTAEMYADIKCKSIDGKGGVCRVPDDRKVTELALKVDLSGGKCTPGKKRRRMRKKKEGEIMNDRDEDGEDRKKGGRGKGGKDGDRDGQGRDGKGRGDGDRDGKGRGDGDRDGKGRGDGDRDGQGRDGKGRGDSDRDGHGRGDEDRDGQGKGAGDRYDQGRGDGDRDGGRHKEKGGHHDDDDDDANEDGEKLGMRTKKKMIHAFGIGPEGKIWVKNGCSGIFVYGYKLAECSLPPSKGMCKAHIRKWYFDERTHKCEQFAWGGCGGNDNRYDSEEECMNSCVNKEVTVSVHEDITISGEIKFNGPQIAVLPPRSCATVQLKDKSLMDMPSISLASITFNVTGSNLTDGLAYQLEVNKPMDRAYIVSVAIKVGHCSDKEISVEAALKLGDYLTMRPHEIKMVEGESSYMRDIVVECVGKCNRCKQGFYKDSTGKCVVIQKVLKTSLKMKKEFTPELKNPSSEEFQNLALFFEKQILELANKKETSYITDVIVTGFKQGSIIVEYDIVIANNAPAVGKSDVAEAITEAVENGELDALEPDMDYPIEVKVEVTGSFTLDTTTLERGKLIKTLPILPKTYVVEVSVKLTKQSNVWTSVVHFTTGGNDKAHGDRTPALFFRRNALHITNTIGGNKNYYFDTYVKLNTWYNIKIIKSEHYGTYWYSVYVNGKSVKKVEDRTPRSFKNVRVYATDPWYPKFDGEIRDLRFTDLTMIARRKKEAAEFAHVGCYRDTWKRAISGKYDHFKSSNVIQLCYEKARSLGNKYFAVQYNTECFTSKSAGLTYDRYGKTTGCRFGRGGIWKMDVFKIRDIPALKRNVATYWGQDVAGQNGLHPERSLGDACEQFKYDIISVQFVRNFFSDLNKDKLPSTNLSRHCSQKFNGYPELMNCPSIGRDIKMCQAKGKMITLSLGGSDVRHSFKDVDDAKRFAKTIWNLFLGGESKVRPFGDNVVFNGIDLNMKGGNTLYYADFVKAIRELMDKDKKHKYAITATLKCILDDDAIDIGHAKHLLGDIPHELDHLYLKVFTKDKKGRKGKKGKGKKRTRRDKQDDDDNKSYLDVVLHNWFEFSKSIKKKRGKGPEIYVALLADPRQDGGEKYYIPPTGIEKIMGEIGFEEEFGGVMIWDASYDSNNKINGAYFSTHVQRILNSPHLYRALRLRDKDDYDGMSHKTKDFIIGVLVIVVVCVILKLVHMRHKRINALKVTPRDTSANRDNTTTANDDSTQNDVSLGRVNAWVNAGETQEEPPLPAKVIPQDDYRVAVPYSQYNSMPPPYAQEVPNGYAFSAAPPSYSNVMGGDATQFIYPVYPNANPNAQHPPQAPPSPPLAPVEI